MIKTNLINFYKQTKCRYRILCECEVPGGKNFNEICKQLNISPTTLSKHLESLEIENHIKRIECKDKRKKKYQTTSKGKQQIPSLESELKKYKYIEEDEKSILTKGYPERSKMLRSNHGVYSDKVDLDDGLISSIVSSINFRTNTSYPKEKIEEMKKKIIETIKPDLPKEGGRFDIMISGDSRVVDEEKANLILQKRKITKQNQ